MLFKKGTAKWALQAFEASKDLYFAVDEQGIVRGSCNPAALNALQRPDRNALFPLGQYRALLGCLRTGQEATIRGELDSQPAIWECVPLTGTNTVLVRCSTHLGQLDYAATTDPLTGLANKRQFLDDLREHRTNSGLTALLLADIDHFKQCNDHYGHEVGDTILSAVGRVIAKNTRVEDRSYRYGGEELAVRMEGLINNVDFSRALAHSRAEAIRAGVEQLVFDGVDRPITVSIGVVLYGSKDNAVSRVPEADRALYYAKETGRNRVVFYEDVPTDWLPRRSVPSQPEPAHAVSTTSSAL